MKLAIQYVNDPAGKVKAVQLPFSEWKKVMARLHKYEQMLKMKSDLTDAFEQMDSLRKSRGKKQTLTDFLNEL